MSDSTAPGAAGLYDPLFGDEAVTEDFSPRSSIQAMLDVEVALAGALAREGIIPASSAAAIATVAHAERFDLALLAHQAATDGNLAIPLVRRLTRQVADADPVAALHVHWGATSQDIIDTALVLQLQAALPRITAHLERAISAAAAHARRHIDSVMPGRTWLQQATPITFGLKAAGWADALDRRRHSLNRVQDEARVLQFGGASGTLAAFGDKGSQVAALIGERLGLHVPNGPWHAHRDRLAALAGALGVACGTCGKIAKDIALLSQTEVGEASDTVAGGSSTMPHKRNPVSASVALAASVRAPGLVATMLAAMPQEHERGLGGWQAEWTTLPDLVRVTAGAARATASALEQLTVDPERMRANLALTDGLTMSEAVTMALARAIGRAQAHDIVERATRRAREAGESLEAALIADPDVSGVLTPEQIKAHLSPDAYLGSARILVENILGRLGHVRDRFP